MRQESRRGAAGLPADRRSNDCRWEARLAPLRASSPQRGERRGSKGRPLAAARWASPTKTMSAARGFARWTALLAPRALAPPAGSRLIFPAEPPGGRSTPGHSRRSQATGGSIPLELARNRLARRRSKPRRSAACPTPLAPTFPPRPATRQQFSSSFVSVQVGSDRSAVTGAFAACHGTAGSAGIQTAYDFPAARLQ